MNRWTSQQTSSSGGLRGYSAENLPLKMVSAWYMDESKDDPRLPHHRSPPTFVSIDSLRDIGVEYFKIEADHPESDETLLALKKSRGYSYEDEIVISKDSLTSFEEKLKIFFTEHLHTDEEIRLVLDGSGYFDVRDPTEAWIRIQVEKGDLLILPAGIYHRFSIDEKNQIKAKRFFIGEPVWTPYNRPVDDMDCRKKYLKSLEKGNFKDVATCS